METTLDPLANSELQRALAFARARESYPGIPSELLLELCDAAWERAAGEAADGRAVDRFERAMQLVARAYRVGGGRISVAEVAEQAIPRAALRRYVRPATARTAAVEPDDEPERERKPFLARIPMARPAPVGVSVAAGLFGFVAAAQAGALPAGPLSFTGMGDDGSSSHVRPEGDHAQHSSRQATAPTTLGQAALPAAPHGQALGAGPASAGPDLAHTSSPGPAPEQVAAPRSTGGSVAAAPVAAQPVSSPQVAATPVPAAAPVAAAPVAPAPKAAPPVALDTPTGDIEIEVPAAAPAPTGSPQADGHGNQQQGQDDPAPDPVQTVTDTVSDVLGHHGGQNPDAGQPPDTQQPDQPDAGQPAADDQQPDADQPDAQQPDQPDAGQPAADDGPEPPAPAAPVDDSYSESGPLSAADGGDAPPTDDGDDDSSATPTTPGADDVDSPPVAKAARVVKKAAPAPAPAAPAAPAG